MTTAELFATRDRLAAEAQLRSLKLAAEAYSFRSFCGAHRIARIHKRLSATNQAGGIVGVACRPRSASSNITRWATVTHHGLVTYYTSAGPLTPYMHR